MARKSVTARVMGTIERMLSRYVDPYGYRLHGRLYGTGYDVRLRTERLAQPCVLRTGDVLATGDIVRAEPKPDDNGRGMVSVLLSGRFGDEFWVEIPAHIPVALLTEEDDLPLLLRRRLKK